MADADYEERGNYNDNENGYSRDRSRSPRADRDGDTRLRDADDRDAPSAPREDESPNEGSNLFTTGIHPRLTEEDVQRLFEKYGDVESCSIMRDPHTRESRGFGFVKMQTSDQADAAKNGLNGEVIEGRTLSIEKARRSKPRTPTPGRYYGPPKREDRRPPRGFGGGGGGFRDDRREGGGYGRRDDRGGYRDRYDDRAPRRDDDRRGGGYRDDRYRDDRYRDERRGGGSYGGRDGGYEAPTRGYDGDRYERR